MIGAAVGAVGEVLHAGLLISRTGTGEGEESEDLETHGVFVRVVERIVDGFRGCFGLLDDKWTAGSLSFIIVLPCE